jgi:formylmethanofuran dehydrogenase subunit E
MAMYVLTGRKPPRERRHQMARNAKQMKIEDCVNCGNYLTVMEQTLAAKTKKMLCEFCIGAK